MNGKNISNKTRYSTNIFDITVAVLVAHLSRLRQIYSFTVVSGITISLQGDLTTLSWVHT